MKIKVDRNELVNRLADIQYIVERKGSLPYLNHFLLKAVKDRPYIIATDVETAIKEPIKVEIIQEGDRCIQAKKLLEIAKELEGEITIETVDEGWVKVRSEKTNFRLTCLSAEDFPTWPSIDPIIKLTMSQKDLSEMISKTIYAAGESDTRFYLNGLLFHLKPDGTVTFVGTDGHRLAMVSKEIGIDVKEERRLILSRKSVSEIRRALSLEGDTEVSIGKNYVLFKLEEKEVLSRLVEGSYPNYENVIPTSNEKIINVGKDDILRSLRRASIIGKEKTSTVVFDIERERLLVSASNPEVGDYNDEIDITFSGEPLKIAFSARLLIDAIAAIESDRVLIKIDQPLSPVLIVSDSDDSYKSVVMPVRL